MVKKNLTNNQRDEIAHFLLANSSKLIPFKGKITEASLKWGVDRKTIWLWWTRAKEKISNGDAIHLTSKKIGNTNAPKVVINREMIRSMPVKNRGSIIKLAKKLKVGYGTVQRWVKKGELRKHTNAIHPTLNDSNKLKRLLFALTSTFVDLLANKIVFKDMSNQIHIDEKWFYITKTTDSFYILSDEVPPYRSCQSKRFITKVMFMSAVSRPIYGEDGDLLFDGKIGMFPFIEEQPATRRSKNREAGTMVTKPIDSITKQVVKNCLINNIIPAIKAKWPANMSKDIYIQQDNARPHISDLDAEFRAAASSDGFNIHLVFQPPNSPDLNINDLGFFKAIQTLQNEIAATTVLELVVAVATAYVEHVPMKLNFNFLTLQGVMVEIMKCKGHNDFSIPHMKKGALLRQGNLPKDLSVDLALVRECLDYLHEKGEGDAVQYLREGIQQLVPIEVIVDGANVDDASVNNENVHDDEDDDDDDFSWGGFLDNFADEPNFDDANIQDIFMIE